MVHRCLWLLMLFFLPSLAWGQALSRREAALHNPLEYGALCNTATLTAAINAAPATGGVLMLTPVTRTGVACVWAITSNLTIPSTLVLHVPQGASVVISSGVTLTLARYPREDNRTWKTGAGTLVITEINPATGVVNVQDLGARGDNTTDDRAAIQAAITLVAATGGTVYFPPGTYYTGTTVGSVSVSIPIATPTFQPETQAFPYQFLITAVDGIHFVGPGATLRSGYTLGGSIFLFDGCRDITWNGINMTSVTTFNSAGTVSAAGMHALAFTSTARDSTRITIENFASTATYSSVYVFGDPATGFRVVDMRLANILHVNNYYGLAFHNNGYNVRLDGIRSVGGGRSYFAFGVYNHEGDLLIEPGTPDVQGFNAVLIKAYNFNTENIVLKIRYNRASTSTKVELSSQHNVAAQAIPGKVRNIVLNYNEQGRIGGGGIGFSYYQDASLQATSSAAVFDNITLRGIFENDIVTGTVFTGAGVVKLNIDDVVFVTGSPSILDGKGFYRYPYKVYIPTLAFGGASVGLTYSTQLGEYFEVGNMVFGSITIALTAKGSSTGFATVTLPRTVNASLSGNPLVQFVPLNSMAGLTEGFSGWLFPNTTTVELLQRNTGATGMENMTDANFTNSSIILLTFAYSK